jgi:hypothetical protein
MNNFQLQVIYIKEKLNQFSKLTPYCLSLNGKCNVYLFAAQASGIASSSGGALRRVEITS